MTIINPSVELWTPESINQHVARCARVCYGKESGDDEFTINNLNARKHFSPYRHFTRYFIVKLSNECTNFIYCIWASNMAGRTIGLDIKTNYKKDTFYIAINNQWVIEHIDGYNKLKPYEVTADEFNNTDIGHSMMRYTFCCVTQISTSRELNRVSPNNILEQSTRYVYEDGSICKPWWINARYYNDNILNKYIDGCQQQFALYKELVDNGMKKEDARGLLPLDTATKVVYTYSVDEWQHIIDLRYYGTTGKPHPNAKIIADMIRCQLKNLSYDV